MSSPSPAQSKLLVILNPAAGQTNPAVIRTKIDTALSASGLKFEIRETKGEGDALEWAKTATDVSRVLVGGGDGTVMEVLSGMIQNPAPVPFAILPLGTANLLSRAFGIPIDLEGALKLSLADGVVVTIDIGHLPNHDRYFAIVAGSGWDAQLIDDATREMKNKLGFFAYVITGIRSLFSLKSSDIRAVIDGKPYRFRAHTLMVLNVGEIHGTPVAVGENVSPHDGKLDLLVASNSSLWGITKLVFRILTKRFHGGSELRYFKATTLELSASPPLKLEIDGECIGKMPVSVRVVPAGARLVVPRDYSEAKGLKAESLG